MRDEKNIQTSEGVLKLEEPPTDGPLAQQLTAEHAEKGSLRSMWELLMQLRVLLPYLTRLAPLLDRGLVRAAPDMTEFRTGMQNIHAGSRELTVQVRNQALQLERIGEQLFRLREIDERNQRETMELSRGLKSLTSSVRVVAILTGLIFLAMIAVIAIFASQMRH